MKKDLYTMETGMARDFNPVIKCSPMMYDKLIQEARDFFSEALANTAPHLRKKAMHNLSRNYPALGILASQPMVGDIKTSN